MNELLAIIIIVLVCCAMFFAWLVSMATCLDRMVNLISGPTGYIFLNKFFNLFNYFRNQQNSSSSSSSSVSKELILSSDNTQLAEIKITKNKSNNTVPKKKISGAGFFQFVALGQKSRCRNERGNYSNLKKLSVVPEQDEQVNKKKFF